MRYLLSMLAVLMFPLPVMAQDAEQQTETNQEQHTTLDFSRSLMFQQEALDKFMELYDMYQARAARGEVAPIENTVDLDIVSEVEQEIDPEHVVFTLNSVLWDKGMWTIWVNGRKYEKKHEDEPILIGSAQFHIVSVGQENATFMYQPGVRAKNLVHSRYENRDEGRQRFRPVLVRGADVVMEGDGESYVFTLRPNQNFRAEHMVLTEGMGFPAIVPSAAGMDGASPAGDAMPEAQGEGTPAALPQEHETPLWDNQRG